MKLDQLVGLLTLRQHAMNLMNGIRGDLKLNKENKDNLWSNIKKIDNLFLDTLSEVVVAVEKEDMSDLKEQISENIFDDYNNMFSNSEGLATKDPELKVKTMKDITGKKSGFIKFGENENLKEEVLKEKTAVESMQNLELFQEQYKKISDEINEVFAMPLDDLSKEEFSKKISGFFGAKGKVSELNKLFKNMNGEARVSCGEQLNQLKVSFEKYKKERMEKYKTKS